MFPIPLSAPLEGEAFTSLDKDTIDAVLDNLVKQRRTLSAADWGILVHLGASEEGSTFSEIDLWLEQEAGRDFGDSTLRKSFDQLADRGFIVKYGKRATGRVGPQRDVWKITEHGRVAVVAAAQLVLATGLGRTA